MAISAQNKADAESALATVTVVVIDGEVEVTDLADKLVAVLDPEPLAETHRFDGMNPRMVYLNMQNAMGEDVLTELYEMSKLGNWPA